MRYFDEHFFITFLRLFQIDSFSIYHNSVIFELCIAFLQAFDFIPTELQVHVPNISLINELFEQFLILSQTKFYYLALEDHAYCHGRWVPF